jgi:hypothetical protein
MQLLQWREIEWELEELSEFAQTPTGRLPGGGRWTQFAGYLVESVQPHVQRMDVVVARIMTLLT